MQYRLGVRLLDVALVMRYAQCIVNDHSCHWSNVQKPHPQPVLHIHPPQHLRGHQPLRRGVESSTSRSTFSILTPQRLRVERTDFTPCQ